MNTCHKKGYLTFTTIVLDNGHSANYVKDTKLPV